MAVDAITEETLDSISVGRRICANTMEPLYKHLADLDALLYGSKRDSDAFSKKQLALCKDVLKDMWDFPIFESDSTDKDLDNPPKMYLNGGKPLKIQTFEKKCLAACKNAKKKKAPVQAKKVVKRGTKRNNAPSSKAKKKPKTGNKKKAWHCDTCKTWHAHKTDYKCPKK